MSRVGFVGAGRMGAPMVRRLVDAGHDVSALGRTDEKRGAVAALGATPVAAPAEVADGADTVVVCVFTDEQVRQVCLDSDLLTRMPADATVVIHTTGSPRTARDIAERAGAQGVGVVDAPVSGGPHDIAAGRVTLFAGGSAATVDRVRPVLAAYGDPLLHVGDLGSGQAVKLLNNAMFAAQVGLLREAVAVGARLGVSEHALLAALPHGSGSSRVATYVAPRGSVAAFVDAAGEFIRKDVDVVREVAASLGTDLGLLDDVVKTGLAE